MSAQQSLGMSGINNQATGLILPKKQVGCPAVSCIQKCDADFPMPGPPKIMGAKIGQPTGYATAKQVMNNDLPETFF